MIAFKEEKMYYTNLTQSLKNDDALTINVHLQKNYQIYKYFKKF